MGQNTSHNAGQNPGQNPGQDSAKTAGNRSRRHDIVAFGIAAAAIIQFVGIAGTLMPQVLRSWLTGSAPPDPLLVNALLLNIALVLLGWRRYSEMQREVAIRRQTEEEARLLASTDPLTKCLNRLSSTAAIQALLETGQQVKRNVAVFLIDLDNFKQINDLNSHQTGDLVLTVVADRLRLHFPAGSVIARVGGDEFVCAMIVDPALHGDLDHFAALLIEQVGQPVADGRVMILPRISAGYALSEPHTADSAPTDAATLVHRADIAMYHAKKSGRNRHVAFQPLLEDDLRLKRNLEAAIRDGIAKGEFAPFYEQQVDLQTGKLVGFEMLARWHSPHYGLVSPEVFIPIAEEMDLISELSENLIRQALADAREWDPSLTLSVNISPVQFRDAWFAQKLLQLLVEAGFPPSRLEIEITESTLHENVGAVRNAVTSLKNQGVRVCLDDFGTGYSSLSQLRSLPFDRIKIDRSFVSEIGQDSKCGDLVAAIVSLGRGLDLPVTAEGIESSQVRDALRDLGGMKGQGYLFGMPEDASTTRARLAAMKLLAGSGSRQEMDEPAAEIVALPGRQAS
ncbi:putative bifunctional diguanylate cyclase/phosphodiesterase [Alteraurantiacibacter palmitatis]|uniref:Bifunctional diguanylate cyclase/phosphodiesterase n=1 Tax=Alteraurantiacibacter palmitatis TaxID=2054628 RepID=A0ABV7E7A9_9SPHN